MSLAKPYYKMLQASSCTTLEPNLDMAAPQVWQETARYQGPDCRAEGSERELSSELSIRSCRFYQNLTHLISIS